MQTPAQTMLQVEQQNTATPNMTAAGVTAQTGPLQADPNLPAGFAKDATGRIFKVSSAAPGKADSVYAPKEPPIVSTGDAAQQDIGSKMGAMESAGAGPQQVTLYGPNGSVQNVVQGDANYTSYLAQGWGTTPGSFKSPEDKSAITTTGGDIVSESKAALDTRKTQLDIVQSKQDAALEEYTRNVRSIMNGTYALTPDQQSLINNMTQQYGQLVEQQKVANKNYEAAVGQAGISAGRNMYAPEVELGNINAAVAAGTQKIAELNTQMNSAILNAREAFKSNNLKAIDSAYNAYSKALDAREKAINDTYSSTVSQMKLVQDSIKQKQEMALVAAQIKELENKPLNQQSQIVQGAVADLMTKYPDAGIVITDTPAQIAEKVKMSPMYKADLAKKSSSGTGSWKLYGHDVNGNNIYVRLNADGTQEFSNNPPANELVESSVSGVNIGGFDISSYATDPNHENAISGILTNIGKFNSLNDVSAYINKVAPGSPVTADMISKTSEKYGIPWEMLVAMMQQDSSLGTAGKGARTFNPGNVGNTDSGAEVNYGTWQAGVDAVGNWLNKHRAASSVTGQRGDNIYKQLNPQNQKMAEEVANYNADLTRISSALKPSIIAAATELNPNFSQSDYPVRQKFKTQWTSGTIANSINAINTFANHVSELTDVMNTAANSNVPAYNAVLGWVAKQSGKAGLTAADATIDAVASEFAKILKGGNAAPTTEEISAAKSFLSSTQSPMQSASVITTLSNLMGGRVNSLRDQWRDAMGSEAKPVLRDSSRASLRGAGLDPDALESSVRTPSTDEQMTSAAIGTPLFYGGRWYIKKGDNDYQPY